MKLIEFTNAEEETDVFVNPEQVQHLYAGPDGGTVVQFVSGYKLLVDGDSRFFQNSAIC